MKEIILTPQQASREIKFDLITSKAFVYLDHVTASGLDSIDQINKLKVTVQPSDPSGQKLAPIQVDIRVDPNQKQSVFEIKKNFKRHQLGDDLLTHLILQMDASEISNFEEIKLRFTCEDAYELEPQKKDWDSYCRAIYLGIKEGINTLEELPADKQEIFRNSRFMKLYEELKSN